MARGHTARSSRDADVVIVGAGAAGLAAASHLCDAGRAPLVIEARDRVGGRILTERAAGLAAPIELGAEFLHGEARAARAVALAHDLPMVDIADHHYQRIGTKLVRTRGYWAHVERALRRLDPNRRPDRSFADAMAANRGALSPLDRVLATQFVEGFEAADASRISERSLAAQGGTSEQSREMRAGRLLDGYGALVDRLAAPLLSRIERGVTVSAVRWRRGHVEVECRDQADAPLPLIRARAAVITVPVGVLAAPPDARGAIRFEPAVPGLAQILSGLVMGHVVKLMLRFADAFWTDEPFGHRVGAPDLDQASFLHSRARVPFPVWWTTYPVRAPLLVAWAGGPAAEAMSRNSPEELERAAVASLAAILGAAPRTIRRKLLAVHHHDWTADPFSRGAYSYAAVGGDRAATRLSHSVAQTLWFAGEGTAGGADAGTVHGAIASGCRAARGITARRT